MNRPIDILLVDDEARNLDALEAILSDPGYRLLRAQDADQALRLLLENEVAAIVLDIKMPGVSGFELARMIKNTKRFRETPLVFLTAYMMDDQDVVAGYGAGAVDYMTKPVNPVILRHKIAVFAELFRKTRALAELNEKLEERVEERTADLKRSESALLAAASQKDEFLAVLAHELRNPLAPMQTGIDILLRQGPRTPVAERTLASMNRQIHHMVRLIDDLLDVSRISRGLIELKREPIDVAQVVRSAIDNARPFFERRNQEVVAELERGIRASADATRLVQIVTNLLHNAAKFSPAGTHTRVQLTREGEGAVIRVIDAGVGLAADQLERVFEMFARVQLPSAPTELGLGIGLALARRLTSMHGGTLIATSDGEGRGSTFTLTLPALPAKVAPSGGVVGMGGDDRDTPSQGNRAGAADEGSRDPRPAGFDVLVVEDNEDAADTLMMLLEAMGHRVSVARTGPQGLALIRQNHPQLVFCDLGLPEMDGLEVCRGVRGLPLGAQPVMVALTGWGREDDRRRTKAAGFDHHLVKPVDMDRLQEVFGTMSASPSPAP